MEEVLIVEELARQYGSLRNSDPYQDVLIGEVDGRIVGYHRVEWWDEDVTEVTGADIAAPGLRVYAHHGVLAPAWRDQGIEQAMFHHAERRLRAVAAGHPPGPARAFQTWATSTQPALSAVIRSEGYTPVRYYFDMVRPLLDDIPRPPLPPGSAAPRPVLRPSRRWSWSAPPGSRP